MAQSDDGRVKMLKLIDQMPHIALMAVESTMAVAKDLCKQTTAFVDRTGNLRKSIDAGVVTAGAMEVTGALSAGYPEHGDTEIYAGLVELGHGGRYQASPHPYIEPTMELVHSTNVLASKFVEAMVQVL